MAMKMLISMKAVEIQIPDTCMLKRVLMTLSLKNGDRMQPVPHSYQDIPLNCCLKQRRMVKRDKHQIFKIFYW